MPFTPYHFGPNGFVGLVFRRWLDLCVIVLANVIVDVEVLFAEGWFPHRSWHFHTLLVGTLVGAVFGVVMYFAKPIRCFFEWAMRLIRIPYKPVLWKMIASGILGVWLHVIIDAFYHYDVQPFWPYPKNPLWRFAYIKPPRITHQHIEIACLVLAALAVIVYTFARRAFLRNKADRG